MCNIHPVQPAEAKAAIRLLRHKVCVPKKPVPVWFKELEEAFDADRIDEAFMIVDATKTLFTETERDEVDLLTGLWNALAHLKYGDYDPKVGPPLKPVPEPEPAT